MNRARRGRPLVALVLAALAAFAAAPATPAAGASYGNLVEVAMPRPGGDAIVLARVRATMALRPGRSGGLGALAVRRAGGRLPRGFDLAAVRARPRGGTVIVWLAAVRTRPAARRGRPLRVALRIGGERVAYRRATTWSVSLRPATSVRGVPGCATIGGEAARWTGVPGLRSIALGGERFGARTAAGAALEVACRRTIRSVPRAAAERFLTAVDRRFAAAVEAVEGFFATWARDAAGNVNACVFVRGARGGAGDVTIGGETRRFGLDASYGVARVDAALTGPGDHPFVVRWRQPGGSLRESESILRVPASGSRGDDPPRPYAAAGNCP